jgi:hypothetical protein
MKRALCIILCLFLASCAPAVAPTPTPSPTATTTPTNTPTATPTSTPTPIPLYQVIFQAFHDYNGNGQQDSEEPLLSGITISTAGKSCTTGNDGTCSIYLPKGAYSVAIKDPSKKFRYILPSVKEVRKISDGIRSVRVGGETKVAVPLGEGFLTLPFRPGTQILGVYEYFDHDPSLSKYLYWNGASGYRKERNHVGTDFRVRSNGIEVVATVPGEILWLGPDPNGGWGIDILTDVDGYTSGVFHLKPVEGLKEGTRVERGQLLGWVEFPGLPHIHVDVKQYRSTGLYFFDSYKPKITECTEYYLVKQGIVEPSRAKCPPGYWIVTNNPTYP